MPNTSRLTSRLLSLVLLASVVWLAACTPVSANQSVSPTPIIALTETPSDVPTLTAQPSPTATPTPTATVSSPTPTPSPTPQRTPSPLPPVFTTTLLAKDSIPVEYVVDQCEYLKNRWDANKSQPGTVVMVIMYHSVTKDDRPLSSDGSGVHHADLVKTLEHAHETGFETITAAQLADFLDNNARIPRRSLLIIVDDRKRKEYYETHFIPFLEQYHWTITNAWISAKDTPDYLWKENEEVAQAGWVDVQAHGVVHNIPIGEYSTDADIRAELDGSIEAIEKHYGKRPIAFIWPGGGFTARAAQLAVEAGYRLGFTTNPRGPLMYNWVPQAAEKDPNHPFWLPEIPVGNPLMTLPRYWSSDAVYRIDNVIAIGDEAAAQAQKDRANELEYYDVMCKPRSGEIPALAP